MLRWAAIVLLAAGTLLAGCKGDEERTTTPGGNEAPQGSGQTLGFEQVEGFTIERLEDEAGIKGCDELAWVKDKEQKRLLVPITSRPSWRSAGAARS